jgi:hypothetical protein
MDMDMDSDSSERVLEYTRNSTHTYNVPLFNRISHITGYNSIEILKALDLQSIILLNAKDIISVSSVTNTEGMSYYTGRTALTRFEIPKKGRILEMAFTSSTTLPMNGMYHISELYDPQGNPRCCLKWFWNDRLPIFRIPEKMSLYPDQYEVIIPFDIITEFDEITSEDALLFDNPRPHRLASDGRFRTQYDDIDIISTDVSVYRYHILTRILSRELIDYINTILRRYYPDNWTRVCSLIILGCIVYANMCEHIEIDTSDDDYIVLILVCLFRYSGRQEYPHDWEDHSAAIAHRELKHSALFKKWARKVYDVLNPRAAVVRDPPKVPVSQTHRLYLAYKGAEGIDRRSRDEVLEEPVHMYEVYSEESVSKYSTITTIIDALISRTNKDTIPGILETTVPKADEPWFTISFPQIVKEDSDFVTYHVIINTLNAPIVAKLFTGNSYQTMHKNDDADGKGLAKYYTVDSSYTLKTMEEKVPLRDYLSVLKQEVEGMPKELLRLINDVDERFPESVRGKYLFDYFCTLFYSVIHYHDVYHRYISYIKYPFYTSRTS